MVEAQGKDEEAEQENFCGESAPPSPPTAENPDEDEPADKEHVTMLGLLKHIFFDVLLPMLLLVLEVKLVKEYFEQEHIQWAASTIAVMALPGTLELLYYIQQFCCGHIGALTFLKGIVFSVTFPLSVPARLLFHIVCHLVGRRKGRHFNRYDVNATNQILHNIDHLTKAPLQIILQAYLMMKEWNHVGGIYRARHLAIILFHIFVLARTLTSHYFFTVSGKDLNAKAPVKATLSRISSQIWHIIIRLPILVSAVASLKLWTLVPLILWVLINWVAAKWVLKTDWNKEIYAAFAGILAPTAFISRHTLKKRKRSGPKIWKGYTRCNAAIFFLFTVLGFLTLSTLVLFTHYTGLIIFPECHNIPYLFLEECPDDGYIENLESLTNGTCVAQILTEIEKALPEDLRPHFLKQKWWFFYHPFLIALAAIDVGLVWFE